MEINVISFEEGLPEGFNTDSRSSLSISSTYKRDGEQALLWRFPRYGQLDINCAIPYRTPDLEEEDKAELSFVINIYAEEVLNGAIDFLFYKGRDLACSFRMELGFQGWRTLWVPYDRSMTGAPVDGMDRLSLVADCDGGLLYIDQMILAIPIDARHPTRDYQIPFVNYKADSQANAHWMSLYRFAQLAKSYEAKSQEALLVSVTEINEIKLRLLEYILSHAILPENTTYENLIERWEQYEINEDARRIRGRVIDLPATRAVWPDEEKANLMAITRPIGIKETGELLLHLGLFYRQECKGERKEILRAMFLSLIRLTLEQGFAYGSGIGTVHHAGYQMRELYQAVFIMEDVLAESRLLESVRRSLEWFSGLGRVFRSDEESSQESIDTLNTLSHGMLIAIILKTDEHKRSISMRAYSHWLNVALSPRSGLKGPFKWDGSCVHHGNHYPAYGRDGLLGITPVVYFLSGTSLALGELAHQNIKYCTLMMRVYSNKYQWLISLSARHPLGEGRHSGFNSMDPFWYLALAGSPDGGSPIDKEMAEAFLRLEHENSHRISYLKDRAFEAERAPVGHWTMPYAACGLHRREEWLVGVRGHSRYLWANESYLQNNLYGRYISHGHLQVLGKGDPVNLQASGYKIEGYDFNYFPGTTTIVLPIDELKSRVLQVDHMSGYEEMLLSEECFVGGIDNGWNGLFAMKLREHAKYHGSHRARKSWFFYENLVLCLGSNIENAVRRRETVTTLFQNSMESRDEGFYWSSSERNRSFPFSINQTTEDYTFLLDNKDNGYLLYPGMNLALHVSSQVSRSPVNSAVSEGDFAKAYLSHGKAPQNACYTYVLVPDTTVESMATLMKAWREKPPLEILQQDYQAHIVEDFTHNTQYYVLFEAGEVTVSGVIHHVDTPSLIMAQKKGSGLALRICDPDLRLYEGIEEDQYDENGNYREVSVYSRKWFHTTSIPHIMEIQLHGEWTLGGTDLDSVLCTYENNKTFIRIQTQEARPVEILLESP